MNIPNNLPLPFQDYYYIGESYREHIQGEKYTVVETGFHWHKEFGYVVWITTESDKDTRDVDYCMSCDVNWFHENFKKY